MKFVIGLLIAVLMAVIFISCFSETGFVLMYYFLAIVAFIVFGIMRYNFITSLFKK